MNRKILQLALPSIIANITIPLVGMVDVAISGRLGSAAMIGGMAIATMLFELLYWNFGFLRISTAGITAQAYGRRDFKDAAKALEQSIFTALLAALFILAIQYYFVEVSFLVIDTSEEVEKLARSYFFIRIWAAPATLSLFSIRGWFIGMQNTKSPMLIDITVNLVNLVVAYSLALHTKLGFLGIAWGTLIAQYSGLLVAAFLYLKYYSKRFSKYLNIRESIKYKEIRSYMMMNGNLFVRSISFHLIYSGFTIFVAKYGDTQLAVSTILMKLMLLYSYFIDGFAYAGEALTGRYIGAKDQLSLRKGVKTIFLWGLVIAFIATLFYSFSGEFLFGLMTNNEEVVLASKEYIPWLLLMPIISYIAFTWDGIYIGATASASIRNTMLAAAVGFFITYIILKSSYGIHALWIAYFVHLAIRSLLMTINAKKEVFSRITIKA